VLVQIQEQTLTKQATNDLFSSDDKMAQKAAGGVFVCVCMHVCVRACMHECVHAFVHA